MKPGYLDHRSLARIKSEYRQSKRRLILFDFDGTLVPLASTPDAAILNKESETFIRKLVEDERNRVVIISGRERAFLENQFENMHVILIAEHGFFIRYPETDWIFDTDIDLSWKKEVLPILEKYLAICPGAILEEKFASVAWHYRNTSGNNCSALIDEQKIELNQVVSRNSALQILEGKKVLEIKSRSFNKGTAISGLIRKESFDFILAIGDDETDEDMFRALPGFGISIKIGSDPTCAKYNIVDQSGIYSLFGHISSD